MKNPRTRTVLVATTALLIIIASGNEHLRFPPPVAEAFTCPPASIIRPKAIAIDPTPRLATPKGKTGLLLPTKSNDANVCREVPTPISRGAALRRGAGMLSTFLLGKELMDGGRPLRPASAAATTATIGAAATQQQKVGASPVALAASVTAQDGGAGGVMRSRMRGMATALSLGPAAIALAGREYVSNAGDAMSSAARTVRRSIPIPTSTTDVLRDNQMRLRKLGSAAGTVLRLLRIVGLAAPVALTYPLAKRRSKEFYDRWLNYCLRQSERGGAVVIKLCQWASSRPDIFGTDFCAVFGRLQDGTTPHPWAHTDRVLREAYGEDYVEHLRVQQHEQVLGSGCIAQVYRGTITDDDGLNQDVAIKVIHPGVRGGIGHDLNILRFLAKTLERLPFGYGERLRWNNLGGMVDEFGRMLLPQLDLRNEAGHLDKFNSNFANDPNVVFPQIVAGYDAHPDVLVETFCEGVPVERFCREHAADDVAGLRGTLCELAARTMCIMIFEHNFVHGDLHPGNIYVTPDGKKLVLLDCGIVNEYDDDDHDLIVNIIAAFIRMDGRRAAELMADDSERRLREGGGGDEPSRDVAEYVEQIELLSKTPRKSDFAFEKVTTYANYIFNAAAKHRILMNPTFVSFAMAVKVQEGVALMLNPSFELIRIANPIILRCEANRLRERGFDMFVRQLLEDAWRDWRVKLGQRVVEARQGGGGEKVSGDDLLPPALKAAAA